MKKIYEVILSKRFKKQLAICKKRGKDITKVDAIIDILKTGENLPPKYKQHKLAGDYLGSWECHIEPDWLLIWTKDDNKLILTFTDTGTHSDLFGIELE